MAADSYLVAVSPNYFSTLTFMSTKWFATYAVVGLDRLSLGFERTCFLETRWWIVEGGLSV